MEDDLIQIIAHLQERVKELEEGSCRFNCRTVKDAFWVGWKSGMGFMADEHSPSGRSFVHDWAQDEFEAAYKRWRER